MNCCKKQTNRKKPLVNYAFLHKWSPGCFSGEMYFNDPLNQKKNAENKTGWNKETFSVKGKVMLPP